MGIQLKTASQLALISLLCVSSLMPAHSARNQVIAEAQALDAPTVKSFPDSEVERLTATGLGKFSQGDFAGSVAEYSNALKINPKRGALYLQRGLAYLELEKFQEALSDLNNAFEMDKGNRLAILVCRGRAFTGLKKFDSALADFNLAIKEDPKFALAFISRADAYLCMADDDKALSDLEEALSLDPKQPRAYFLRARYYKHKNKNELALKDFNTAISLDASFLDKEYGPELQSEKDLRDHFARSLKLGKKKELGAQLIERGLAHERSGEYLDAIREFTDAISDTPDSLEAYKWRASVYMHMAAFQNAIDDLNRAIAISPNDPNLRAERAKAHLENGQSDKAIEDYSKAIELSKDPPANLFEARGLVYSREGKSQQAVLDFGKSIELDPKGSTAYADRGLEYVVHKRYQDAVADFDVSINNGHDLPVCYKFRGQCRHYLGDRKGSIDDLEKAAQLYKSQSDLFGCKQIEKLIADFKKEDSAGIGQAARQQASKE